jgi:hypothetical protein
MPSDNPLDWLKTTALDRARRIRQLVKEGFSASEIANAFKGATRNSIIGFARRQSIPLNPPSRRKQPIPLSLEMPIESPQSLVDGDQDSDDTFTQKSPTAGNTPLPVREKISVNIIPEFSTPVRFSEVGSFQCKWPLWENIGTDGNNLCCGAPVAEPTKPYCTHHRLMSLDRKSYEDSE